MLINAYLEKIIDKEEYLLFQENYLNNIFGNNNKIYIEIENNKEDSLFKIALKNKMEEIGYILEDNIKYCYKKEDLQKKKIKTTKIIENNKDFLDFFAKNVEENKEEKYLFVLSKDPIDVLGMSTNRAWNSCMNLENGCNRHLLINDLKYGTLTGYIIKENDKDIKEPVGRINVKPLINGKFIIDSLYSTQKINNIIIEEIENKIEKCGIQIEKEDFIDFEKQIEGLYYDKDINKIDNEYIGSFTEFTVDKIYNLYKNTEDIRKYLILAFEDTQQEYWENIDSEICDDPYMIEEVILDNLKKVIQNYNSNDLKNIIIFEEDLGYIGEKDLQEYFIERTNYHFSKANENIYDFNIDLENNEIPNNFFYFQSDLKLKENISKKENKNKDIIKRLK
jgi:hypothetical protein